MIKKTTRLYHCHKFDQLLTVIEDYEIINGQETLVYCSCPYLVDMGGRLRKCNGVNDHGFPCGYAEYDLS